MSSEILSYLESIRVFLAIISICSILNFGAFAFLYSKFDSLVLEFNKLKKFFKKHNGDDK